MVHQRIKVGILHEGGKNAGVSYSTIYFANELAHSSKFDIHFITRERVNNIDKRIKQIIIPWSNFLYVGRISWVVYLYFKLLKYKFDILHCPFVPGMIKPFPIDFYKRTAKILTVHDLMLRKKELRGDPISQWILYFIIQPLNERFADFILTPTETVRKDIIRIKKWPSDRIASLFWGVTSNFRKIHDKQALEDLRKKHDLPKRFILNVGTIKPNKNIINLIDSFVELSKRQKDFHLVFTGGLVNEWYAQDVAKRIKELPAEIQSKIRFLNFVPYDDLPGVYNLAEIFCMPSTEEGFGMPLLEAMACGIPCVTSTASCLPEIAGDAAVKVDHHSISALAEGMEKVITDDKLRDELIRKGFERAKECNWKATAKRVALAYRAALKYKGNPKYKLVKGVEREKNEEVSY